MKWNTNKWSESVPNTNYSISFGYVSSFLFSYSFCHSLSPDLWIAEFFFVCITQHLLSKKYLFWLLIFFFDFCHQRFIVNCHKEISFRLESTKLRILHTVCQKCMQLCISYSKSCYTYHYIAEVCTFCVIYNTKPLTFIPEGFHGTDPICLIWWCVAISTWLLLQTMMHEAIAVKKKT